MKKSILTLLTIVLLTSCNSKAGKTETTESTNASKTEATQTPAGQSGGKDEVSKPNIVQTAAASEQHTTLVAAVKAAGLIDALSNVGPFTVFAPTNEAFDKLPAGTVENLLKPENKKDLVNILSYHTYVGVLSDLLLKDGKVYDQVNGSKIKISRNGDKILVNDSAEIIAKIPTSNGIILVIDNVLLPPSE